jgi:hypothetical protein
VNNVLTVPNAALRLKPTADMLVKAGQPAKPSGTPSGKGASQSSLWTLDSNGGLHAVAVKTGMTDGQRTAVDGIDEGTKVITALETAGAAPAAPSGRGGSSASPFQSGGGGGPRGGPPGM